MCYVLALRLHLEVRYESETSSSFGRARHRRGLHITACHKNEAFLPGAGHHYGQKKAREFRVYIYSDGQYPNACFADLAVATLWKNQQQTVTWVSDDGYEYTVDFSAGQHGSPFSQTSPTFDIPADKETKSGSLNVNASGYYDFLIRAGSASGPP